VLAPATVVPSVQYTVLLYTPTLHVGSNKYRLLSFSLFRHVHGIFVSFGGVLYTGYNFLSVFRLDFLSKSTNICCCLRAAAATMGSPFLNSSYTFYSSCLVCLLYLHKLLAMTIFNPGPCIQPNTRFVSGFSSKRLNSSWLRRCRCSTLLQQQSFLLPLTLPILTLAVLCSKSQPRPL
jgi:hypothetical protein